MKEGWPDRKILRTVGRKSPGNFSRPWHILAILALSAKAIGPRNAFFLMTSHIYSWGFSMGGIRVIPCLVLSLTLSGSAPILAQNPASRQQPSAPQQPVQSRSPAGNQAHVKTFAGKIAKSKGKYVLQDLSSANSYALDDQKTASKYAGKVVLVTGVLDSNTNTIRVQKIDTAV